MKENKLGLLLSSFKDEDWSAYHKFSKSRYGDETDHQKVMEYIKKHKSRYDPNRMDTEYLRNKIRPDAKSIVFSNVISQLCKHIEAYFIWAEVMEDTMMEDTLLLKAYARRGLTNQFHKLKKKAKKNRDKQPLGLWNNYHVFMGKYLEYYNRMTTSVAGSKSVLESCNQAIIDFSNVLQEYLGVEMHSREIILAEKFVSNFKNLSPQLKFKSKNLTSLFHYYKKLKENRDWDSYAVLKQELYEGDLSKELQFTSITYLGSFLKWKNLNNDEKAGHELVQLYNYGLNKDILFPNRIIPLDSFAIIITIGSNTGNPEWSENFINNYSHLVSDKNSEQIRNYGHAHLSYTKRNFQNTIEILRSKRFNDFNLELKAKWLLISSLYELNPNDIEIFKYYTNSLISYIKRNSEKSTIDGNKAFLTSLNYLSKLVLKKNLGDLEDKIINEKKMVHKRWFLEKIKGLRA
jgi:hypothetical protein